MAVPSNVTKLQTAIEGAMDDLQKRHFFPMQKQAFLCSAKCCDDPKADMARLQSCTNACAAKIQAAEAAIYDSLGAFQNRFQRCVARCQDKATEGLPRDATEKQQEAAQAGFLKCMDSCGSEYSGQIPKLITDLEATLKKL